MARLSDIDTVFSKYVRARDGSCQAQGWAGVACKGNLQAAHVISRRYHGVRFDERNCRALCQAHHMYETHNPLEGYDFWIGLIGQETFDDLRRIALSHRGHLDLKAIRKDFEAKLATLEIDAEPAA